jgi:transcriptional regulator with XRE-family HTH domain
LTEHSRPTVRRRRLAAELRRLRERTGLTGDEVADRLGWSGSKVSRIELHKIGVKQSDLERLLDLYQVDLAHRAEVLALAREPGRAGRLEAVTAAFPAEYSFFIYAETEAQSMWNWEPLLVPGLLQTEDYARAAMSGWQDVLGLPRGDIERRVEARMLRQQALTRDDPLDLSVVMDESVLYRRFGSHQVMRQQLKHLAELSDMPNVRVQVLPLSNERRTAITAFAYLQFGRLHDMPLADIVTVEHLSSSYYFEEEIDTNRYRLIFRALETASLDYGETRELLGNVAREHWE